MKINQVKIDWAEGYANSPTLQLHIDRLPDHKLFRYRVHEMHGGRLYWAALTEEPYAGLVGFYCEVDGDRQGYGGRVFELTLEDGTVRPVKGPWSSNSLSMNQHFPCCAEINVYEDQGPFPNLGYHGFSLLHDQFVYLVQQAGAKVAYLKGIGGPQDEVDPDLYGELRADGLHMPLFLAIKNADMTYRESQEAKQAPEVKQRVFGGRR